jgi:hypothetical protein
MPVALIVAVTVAVVVAMIMAAMAFARMIMVVRLGHRAFTFAAPDANPAQA